MGTNEIIKSWVDSADEDFNVMMSLYKHKHFGYSLFIGHLMLEKLLKGFYAKINPAAPHAPKIHKNAREHLSTNK